MFDDILERKQAFLNQTKRNGIKQIEKLGFFQSLYPMLLVKKFKNFPFFLFYKIDQENVFGNILERKQAFLDYENKEFKKSKNWDFSNGVHGFGQKIENFHLFLLGIIGQENVFDFLKGVSASSVSYTHLTLPTKRIV